MFIWILSDRIRRVPSALFFNQPHTTSSRGHPWSSPNQTTTTADALIYRGDVLAGGGYSKGTATITQGEILKPTTGITGKHTEIGMRNGSVFGFEVLRSESTTAK